MGQMENGWNQWRVRSVYQGSGRRGLSLESLDPSTCLSVLAWSSLCLASSMYSKRCWYCVLDAVFSLKFPSFMWLAASGRSPICAFLRSLYRVLRQFTKNSVFFLMSVCESLIQLSFGRDQQFFLKSCSYSFFMRSSSFSSFCTLQLLTWIVTLGVNWDRVLEDCDQVFSRSGPKLIVVTAGCACFSLSVLTSGTKNSFFFGRSLSLSLSGECDLGCSTETLFLTVQFLKTGPCSICIFSLFSKMRQNQRVASAWSTMDINFIITIRQSQSLLWLPPLHYIFMDHLDNEDSHDHDVQGTIIVPVGPKHKKETGVRTPKKSRRKPVSRSKAKTRVEGEYNEAQESSFNDEVEHKQGERGSQGKMRGADEETMVELQDNGLIQPYEFISQRSPGILSIFFPRRTWRSFTFFLSLAYVLMFLVLIIFNYSRAQTDLSWNCSLYRLQAKYFPRLRYEVEVWRVVLSALLHSNIAHFVLDLFALQVYGYFVEWYFGKLRYCAAVAVSAVYSHFLSCLAQKTSIATTPSAVLFSVLVLKAFFLWEYRNYKKLYERRQFLYILLVLIAGINLIPIFVVNNIDYSAQLGGVIVGLCFGVYALATKQEEQNWKTKALRVAPVLFLIATFAAFVGLVFSESAAEYRALSETIGPRCEGN